MDVKKLQKEKEYEWRIPKTGSMRVPAVLYGDQELMEDIKAFVIKGAKDGDSPASCS